MNEWETVQRLVADGVPSRYFELGAGGMAAISAMDEDARWGVAAALPAGVSRDLGHTGARTMAPRPSQKDDPIPDAAVSNMVSRQVDMAQGRVQLVSTDANHREAVMQSPRLGGIGPSHSSLNWHHTATDGPSLEVRIG